MCRLAAFPPLFPKDKAVDILLNFEKTNTDGVGYSYLNKKKQFMLYKSGHSLSKVLKKVPNFLAHMPYPGWTIAHLRAASHGAVCKENSHPFIVGNWAIAHNGIWSDYKFTKCILQKIAKVKFVGQTDSEVAANCINMLGVKTFNEEIDGSFAGVFLCLNRNGQLWIVKNSGELEITDWKPDVVLLASRLPTKYDAYDIVDGWFHFDHNAKYVNHKKNKERRFSQRPSLYNYNPDDHDSPIDDTNFSLEQYDEEDIKQFIREAQRVKANPAPCNVHGPGLNEGVPKIPEMTRIKDTESQFTRPDIMEHNELLNRLSYT